MEVFFIFQKITHFRESSSSAFVKKTGDKNDNFDKHTEQATLKVFLIIKKQLFTPNSGCDFFKNTKKPSENDFDKIMVLREIPLSLGGG